MSEYNCSKSDISPIYDIDQRSAARRAAMEVGMEAASGVVRLRGVPVHSEVSTWPTHCAVCCSIVDEEDEIRGNVVGSVEMALSANERRRVRNVVMSIGLSLRGSGKVERGMCKV